MAPFIFPYGSFDLSEDNAAVDTNRRADSGDGVSRAEQLDIFEVIRGKQLVWLVSAAIKNSVEGTCRGNAPEGTADCTFIVPHQLRSVNVADQVLPVFHPVITGHACNDDGQLIRQRELVGNTIGVRQSYCHSRFIVRIH